MPSTPVADSGSAPEPKAAPAVSAVHRPDARWWRRISGPWLNRASEASERWWKPIPYGFLAFLVLAYVFVSITANLLTGSKPFGGMFASLNDRPWLAAAGSFVVCLLSFAALFDARRKARVVRSFQPRTLRPRQGLIFFLSRSTARLDVEDDRLIVHVKGGDGTAVDVSLEGPSPGDALRALKEAKVYWNWQPLLRTLERHQDALRRVVLIGSAGPEGSYGALRAADCLVRTCLPEVVVHAVGEAVDFEDVDELLRCIGDAVRYFLDHGVEEREILVDATGGQKTTSIAAAVFTLNTAVNFQYVQTNSPFEVVEYDLLVQSRDLG
jgi:CRISPR-associated protein (Cas_Cas02710)